jgi:hypothetical protein
MARMERTLRREKSQIPRLKMTVTPRMRHASGVKTVATMIVRIAIATAASSRIGAEVGVVVVVVVAATTTSLATTGTTSSQTSQLWRLLTIPWPSASRYRSLPFAD